MSTGQTCCFLPSKTSGHLLSPAQSHDRHVERYDEETRCSEIYLQIQSERSCFFVYPPWNWHSTWNTGVGRWVSFWDGLFSGAKLVSVRVNEFHRTNPSFSSSLFGSPGVESSYLINIGLPGNNRFQIYGELEDQEIAKIKESHHLFAHD